MPMMISQILKYVDFTIIQNRRYLMNKTLFFLKIKKKNINYASKATLLQKIAEVTSISDIIDYYFIMEFFLKKWEKIRTK